MRKRISLKKRRPDLSRAAFREHYEKNHVPLGLSFIDRFQWRRYVRNHVVEASGRPVGFDCYTEFWVDEDFEDEALQRFVQSPEFGILNEDDERFLDVHRRLSFEVRETRVLPAGPGPRPARKSVVLWRRGTESAEEARSLARRIVSSLGDRVVGAMLDTAIGVLPPDAPFDTLLALSLGDAQPVALDPSIMLEGEISILMVDAIETPRERLFGGSAESSTERSGARAGRA